MAAAVRRSGGAAARQLLDRQRASRFSLRQHLLPGACSMSSTVPQMAQEPNFPIHPGHGLAKSCQTFGLGFAGGGGDGVKRVMCGSFTGRLGGHRHRKGAETLEQQQQQQQQQQDSLRGQFGGSRRTRWFSGASKKRETDGDAIASQMIGYAATNRKHVESHVEVSRVLEQGYNFLLFQGPSTENAAAKVLLTLATIYVDGGKLQDAMDVLQRAINSEGASLEVRVSASDALVAVLLRAHKDADALSVARTTAELVNREDGLPAEQSHELKFRAAATVQFVEHASSAKISGALLDVSSLSSLLDQRDADRDGLAATLMGIAECAHIRGHFARAKDSYRRASALAKRCCEKEPLGSGAGATTPEDVRMGAGVGLGQVAAHLGNFDDAEKELTAALVHAEEINGKGHSRVGAVLACLADVYAQRGVAKGGGDLILAEGLYRKALDLLRAPPVEDNPGAEQRLDLADVIAFTRARYATLLARFRNRDSEAKKLQAWAIASWKGPRSLTDVLDQEAATHPTPSPLEDKDAMEDAYSGRYVVIDVRLGRVLYSPSNH